jgi:hypothetical protein
MACAGGRMSKRAIEMQFNWIFILIAGAVILAFFFNVVQKQRTLSEEKLSIKLASQMDAIFSGAIESKGTIQPLATPQPGIAFSCSDTCVCKYHVGKSGIEFNDKLIFAPPLIKEQDARAWAVEWKLPFRIANFLMLTNPAIKYYLVYDSANPLSAQAFQRISKGLPKEINRETISSPSGAGDVSPGGYVQTRFVFIGTSEPDLGNLRMEFQSEDVSGVWLDDTLEKVVFYEKSDPDRLEFNQYPSSLAGEETAYAAIFAADHMMYNCMMERAFDKLGAIAGVHEARARALQETMGALDTPRLDCVGAYDPIITSLANMRQKAVLLGTSFSQEADAQGAGALAGILGVQTELNTQNTNLIKQNCPEIY